MVALGLALNGSIGHAASGIILMIFRPYKVGHIVEIGRGYLGSVVSINALNTSFAILDTKKNNYSQ